MTAPAITAIIPTYKRPHLLKRAVRSLLAQTFSDFEVFVADNSSGKETDEVIQHLMTQDKRVRLLQHKTNIGLTATLQSALMQVSTPFVCFLCDDDFVAPYFFREILPIFSQYSDIAFCGGGAALIDQDYVVKSIASINQKRIPSGYYEPPKGFFAYLHSTFGIGLSSLLIKTEVLKKVGGFDLRIRNGTDEDPISKCTSQHPIYLLTERPYFFAFQHDSNLSSTIDYALFEKECAYLYENLSCISFSSEEKKELDRFFEKRRLKILSSAFDYFNCHKEFQLAYHYAEKMERLTHSFKWKRKKIQANLNINFPFLENFYKQIKNIEKKIRNSLKNQTQKQSVMPNYILPDSAYWKNYALQLEMD